MKGKNFLKIKPKHKKRIMAYGIKRKWTWGKLEKLYRQPRWCDYPEAMRGTMGCWSLISTEIDNRTLNKTKCHDCELSTHYRGNNKAHVA